MLRTFDIILMVVMTAAATVTYSIKHRAELKHDEVKRLNAEIKLEHDTIDLLNADWALLAQPSRVERLIAVYAEDLKLVPTESTQLARPQELPMLKADLPPEEPAGDIAKSDAAGKPLAGAPNRTGSEIADIIKQSGIKPSGDEDETDTDSISTGAVE